MRINLDDYFIKIVKNVSERATCPRKSVGAIIVKNGRIISTGYNGAPKKMEQCDEVGCLLENNHCIRVVHAEMNALLFAGREAEGATLYCTCLPCEICFKLCIQAGIKKIIYLEDYNKENIQYWIDESNIEVIKYG